MLRIENHCCDCAAPGYPCMGRSCPNRRVKVYYCDKCDEEIYDEDFVEDGDRHFHNECYKELYGDEDEET